MYATSYEQVDIAEHPLSNYHVHPEEIAVITADGERRETDSGWRREVLGFITNRHQICVGITRCKYGLLIVGKKCTAHTNSFTLLQATTRLNFESLLRINIIVSIYSRLYRNQD